MIRLFIVFVITVPTPAYAYLDPGTGSMLVSAVIGIAASLFFSMKKIYYEFSREILGFLGMKLKKKTGRVNLAFYSEGKQYWSTFKPLIMELLHRQTKCTYLTQDPEDPGLELKSPYYSAEYIGQGNAGFTRMNFLEANICVMTTPGLDVLQIKRSKGVKHYIHLVHAPTDMGIYKLYSFDYYDSVFVSGSHQKRSLRELEQLRETRPKYVFDIGCLYYDESIRSLRQSKYNKVQTDHNTILVAPTWGDNGLLKKYGEKLLKPLLESGKNIIVRPHPQSYVSEKDLLDQLKTSLIYYKNLSWNRDGDGMAVMAKADMMISDLSGIIFDFAFLFEKPVITLKFEVKTEGLEANDLPYDVWELGVLDQIGKQVGEKEICNITTHVDELLNSNAPKEQIQSLRNTHVYNFGNAASVAAEQLKHISNVYQKHPKQVTEPNQLAEDLELIG